MRSVIGKALVLAASAAFMLACTGLVMAQSRTGAPPPAKKTVLYIVIKVTNTKGDVSYDTLQLDQLLEKQKQLPKDYESALAAWTKAKADADKNKKKFEDKKPVMGKIERVETTPPAFKTTDLAKVEADKLNQKLLDAKKAAAEKPATTSSKPATHTPPTGQVVKPPDNAGDTGKDTPPPPDTTKDTGN